LQSLAGVFGNLIQTAGNKVVVGATCSEFHLVPNLLFGQSDYNHDYDGRKTEVETVLNSMPDLLSAITF